MLPAATPPNLVVFATERVQIVDFIKTGIVLNLVAALFGSLLLYGMAAAVFDARPAGGGSCTRALLAGAGAR